MTGGRPVRSKILSFGSREVMCSDELNRLQLEQKMNVSGTTDAMQAKLRTIRLENYWKKVCDDERKSRMRNQQLLADLDRLDMQASQLYEEIESLMSTKTLNESYVEELYPGLWRRYSGQPDQRRQSEQHQTHIKLPLSTSVHNENSFQRPFNGRNESSLSTSDITDGHQHGVQLDNHISQEQFASNARDDSRISYNVDANDTPHSARSWNNVRVAIDSSSSTHRSQSPTSRPGATTIPPAVNDGRGLGAGIGVHSVSSTPRDQSGSMLISPISNSHSAGGVEVGSAHAAGARELAASTSSPVRIIASVRGSRTNSPTMTEHASSASPRKVGIPLSLDATPAAPQVIPTVSNPSHVPSALVGSGLRTSSPAKSSGAVDSPLKSLNSPSSGVVVSNPVYSTATASPTRSATIAVSPPLKSTSSPSSVVDSPGHSSKALRDAGGVYEHQKTSDDQGNTMSPPVVISTDNSLSVEPDLSWDGMFHLLSVIENNTKAAARGHQQQYYSQTQSLPADGVCIEIINLANRQGAMSHMNVTSLCQIVVGQLSALCHLTPDGCLLTDRALLNFTRLSESLDETEVRKQIHSSSIVIWNKLYSHWLCLVERRISSIEELSAIFGPSLTSQKSRCQHQAIAVLSRLLERSSETMRSPTPSASEFSIGSTPRNPPSPRRPIEPLQATPVEIARPKTNNVLDRVIEVHQDEGDPDTYESDEPEDSEYNQSDNERFVDYNTMSRSMTLKQHAAYDQVLGNTGSSLNSTGAHSMGLSGLVAGDDLDSDLEDMERVLAPAVTVPPKQVGSVIVPPPTVSKHVPEVPKSKPVTAPSSAMSSLKMSSSARSNNIVFRAAADPDLDDDNDIGAVMPSLNRSTLSEDQQRSVHDGGKQNEADEFEDDDFWNESGK